MSFSLGIIGLPNVGKSTLFNALTKQAVDTSNYPFATIDPNVGVVAVSDERLQKIADVENVQEALPTTIEFVDIAGLVKGAHQGEGLGNQFLSHIREVDAIVEVVRCFEDEQVAHVEGRVDPKRDMETIATELILADLQTVEKQLKQAKDNKEHEELKKIYNALNHGQPAQEASALNLLTSKPILYVGNVNLSLNPSPRQGREEKTDPSLLARREAGRGVVMLDAKLESELAELSETERQEYLKELGLKESGLDQLIKACYRLLHLITFFTRESNKVQAWACEASTKAPAAAGKIHTDFERGFIKAEVINWQKLVQAPGWHQAQAKGWIRTEGKDYLIQDGDVIHFKFST